MALCSQTLLVTAVLLLFSVYYSETCLSSSRSSHSFPHSIDSQSGLTNLYNKRVTQVQNYKRPLGGSSWMFGPFYHTGVVVTTEDGEKWLIHKGDGYGRSSQTVIVPASCMSSRWQYNGGHSVSNARVGDYVEAGGKDYSLFSDNCQDARDRMLELY